MNRNAIAAAVREYRTAHNLSQSGFAKKLGKSWDQTKVSRVEQGKVADENMLKSILVVIDRKDLARKPRKLSIKKQDVATPTDGNGAEKAQKVVKEVSLAAEKMLNEIRFSGEVAMYVNTLRSLDPNTRSMVMDAGWRIFKELDA